MRLTTVAIFFACLIGVPIAQVLADSQFDGRRIAIWHGGLDRHQIATTKHRLLFQEFPWLRSRQKTG
jgi:hypothetical protein